MLKNDRVTTFTVSELLRKNQQGERGKIPSPPLLTQIRVKDTHREKAISNETPAPSKSMNVDTWVAHTSNQLFIRGS